VKTLAAHLRYFVSDAADEWRRSPGPNVLATATIAAVLGQESTKMAEHYSKTAHRHHLAGAGIERMEERDRNRNRKTGRKTDL